MSEPGDQAAGADLNVLKAPLPSRHEQDRFRQLRYQLLGYATALGVLITLTPTWLIREYSRGYLQLHSGFGMMREARILGSAANWLFILYLVVCLVALAAPATIAAFACAYAGLVDTVVIVLLKPGGDEGTDIGWTGAPFLAIGLWLVLAVVNHVGWYDLNRRG
ncbi:hypothetical protein [Kribbella sp. NPDC000426]|uniref:hypothetical protein n=1 Tax=Kribbella sp. NPDC000426 TaxID=3154255 RepID=UPI0033349158